MGEEDQIEIIPIELVFVGIRESSQGKKLYWWATLPTLKAEWVWDKNHVPASVGGVYLFQSTNNGTSVFHSGKYGPKYLRRFEDKDQVSKWAIEDEVVSQKISFKSLQTKAVKVEPLEEALENIRLISRRLNKTERRAFFSKISEIIFTLGM
jgi:hypothetical protein